MVVKQHSRTVLFGNKPLVTKRIPNYWVGMGNFATIKCGEGVLATRGDLGACGKTMKWAILFVTKPGSIEYRILPTKRYTANFMKMYIKTHISECVVMIVYPIFESVGLTVDKY